MLSGADIILPPGVLPVAVSAVVQGVAAAPAAVIPAQAAALPTGLSVTPVASAYSPSDEPPPVEGTGRRGPSNTAWFKASELNRGAVPVKPSPASPQKSAFERARDLAGRLHSEAVSRRGAALAAGNLAGWLRAENLVLRARDPMNFEWIYQMEGFEECPLGDYLREEDAPEKMARFEKEARFVREMFASIKDSPVEAGRANVILKRFRAGDSWTYRAIAIFHASVMIKDPQGAGYVTVPDGETFVLYYGALEACVNHACDVLYKAQRKSGEILHMDWISFTDFMAESGSSGTLEFMDSATRELRDARCYMMAAICGYFSNENQRFKIPLVLLG